MTLTPRPFQRRFLRAALAPSVRTAALSLPRGNGKTTLGAYLVTRALTPGDPLHVPGTESLAVAASFDQARLLFRMVRTAFAEHPEYRFSDSGNRIHAIHVPTSTSFRLMGSNAKRAMGLVNVPLVIADEPGAWEVAAGELMYGALETALAKPDSPLRVIYIGTIAPSAPGGWWPRLVSRGSRRSTHVTLLQGDPERWDKWPEIRRCNPLVSVSADFRRRLLEERDEAREDPAAKARFLSYRLNLPTADESTVLLTVDDWKRVIARPVPERTGRPIVGIDLGAGRAWSAAVAVYRNGRVEALAVAPGIPDLAAQEKRDRVPPGTYARLAASGALCVADGLRVQPPAQLWRAVRAAWGRPDVVICDRFRLGELQDAVAGAVPVVPRVSRWSEAAADIRALRKAALDGNLAVEPGSRSLLAASIAVARVVTDDQGSTRLSKRGTNNEARDDVAAALVLAAGALSRAPAPRKLRSALA